MTALDAHARACVRCAARDLTDLCPAGERILATVTHELVRDIADDVTTRLARDAKGRTT